MTSENFFPVPNRVLLATDLSARCDRALDRAALLAAEWGAQLAVIHALEADSDEFVRAPADVPTWRREANLQKSIAARKIHQDLGELDRDFDMLIEEGKASDVILQNAEDGDLIVTGIARNETFGRALFGGTVDRVVRTATAPVLLVKERARRSYKDVLIATDFSEASARAIEVTRALFPDTRLTLIHCYQSLRAGMMSPGSGREIGRQMASGEYAEFIDTHSASIPGLAQLPIFFEYGDVESVIKSYAMDKSPDLVVLGSRGKNSIARLLIGSTAEAIIAAAPSDVLIVPRTGIRGE